MVRLLLATAFALGTGSTAAAATVRDPAWSNDGARLAYVRLVGDQGRIYVVDPTGRNRRTVGGLVAAPYSLTWSPDGSALAYVSNGDIWRVELATGHRLNLTPGGVHYFEQPNWSSDGTEVAFVAEGARFRSWDVVAVPAMGGAMRTLVTFARRPRYQPNGASLLVSDPPRLVDPSTGAVSDTTPGGSYASWASSGVKFAYAGDGGIHVVAVATDEDVVYPVSGSLAFPTLSPAATRVAYVVGHKVLLRSFAQPGAVILPRGDSRNDAPAWSAQGALAYVASSSCGARSSIVVVRSDGSQPRRIAGGC